MTNHLVGGETDTNFTLAELYDELRTINSGSKRIALFGTRNLPIAHQQIVETISYALAQARHTIITSGGASGVNFAAINGAIKADPDVLEVILPQTLEAQPLEVREILKPVKAITEHPDRLNMDFAEASKICYNEIIETANQVICFLYHDSKTLAQVIDLARSYRKIATVFYLD